ncbi:unnamed protein product [Closterium sp. NIES-64]|nr:unnamed protein product [Closterium sp. NIES-64]CAI5989115.1 unnamed protein product [Closterium sp. NIES-64]
MASLTNPSLVGSASCSALGGISSSFSRTRRGANVLKMWRRAIAWRVGRFSEKEQCALRSPRASLGFSPLRPKPVAKPPSKKPRPRDVMGTAAAVKPRAVQSGQATVAAAAVKATPAKATPAKVAPAKVTPIKATPAKATPAKATPPAKVTPIKATPAKATPAKATQAKVVPSKATPAKATPVKATPPAKGVVGEMGGEVEECGELEWGGMA